MRFESRGPSELSAVGLGYVTEMASEDAVQGLAKQAQLRKDFEYRPSVCNAAHSRPELVSPHRREGDLGENTSEISNFLSSFTGVLIGVEFSSWKVW